MTIERPTARLVPKAWGSFDLRPCHAFESHCMHIKVGPDGLQGLIANAGCEPIHDLLRSLYGEIAAVAAYGRERAAVAAALSPPRAQA